MVAGRRSWGQHEERAAEHQAGCGGDLGVEAVVEDRLGTGEARCLGTGVETGRQVDQEDHGEAEQAEGEDDPTQPAPPSVAQDDQGEGGGEHADRDQQVGVGLTGGLNADRGRTRRRQPRVACLPDLDGAVVDELRDDQAGGRGEDRHADRPLRRQYGARPRRDPDRQIARPQKPTFDHTQGTEEQHPHRAQATAQTPADGSGTAPGTGKHGPGALQQAVGRPVDPAGRRDRTRRGTAQAL